VAIKHSGREHEPLGCAVLSGGIRQLGTVQSAAGCGGNLMLGRAIVSENPRHDRRRIRTSGEDRGTFDLLSAGRAGAGEAFDQGTNRGVVHGVWLLGVSGCGWRNGHGDRDLFAGIDDPAYMKFLSLIVRLAAMSVTDPPSWSFLTNHAQALLCIAEDPGIRLREVGELVGVTERAAHRIVAELVAAGYVTRTRHGRRNQYTVHRDLPLPDKIARRQRLGVLLEILGT
jgi:MarR family protein